MAKSLPEKLTREQLLTVLAVLGAVSLIGVTALLVTTRSTVVELELRLDEVSLTVVPPREWPVDLFDPELEVRDLQWKGADRFEATIRGPRAGRATAEPEGSSVIGLGLSDTAGPDATPFRPVVRLQRPLRLKLEPSGYENRLTITFDPERGTAARRLGFGTEVQTGDWICEVLLQTDLEPRLRNVELTLGTERWRDPAVRLEPAAAASGSPAAREGRWRSSAASFSGCRNGPSFGSSRSVSWRGTS